MDLSPAEHEVITGLVTDRASKIFSEVLRDHIIPTGCEPCTTVFGRAISFSFFNTNTEPYKHEYILHCDLDHLEFFSLRNNLIGALNTFKLGDTL